MSEENQRVQSKTPKPNKPKWIRFIGWFDRGIVAIPLGAILGVIGTLILTWYLEEKPNLVYSINPVRTAIVKAGQFSEMTVLVNGQPVTNDLTGVQIAIWNAGKKPIHHSDILKRIVLRAVNKAPIYKTTISKERDVTEFSFNKTNANPDIDLDWRILEKNDGALIQIFYAGDANTDFVLDGVLEGQNSPHRISTGGIVRSWSMLIAIIIGTLGTQIFAEWKFKHLERKSTAHFKVILPFAVGLIIAITFIWKHLDVVQVSPFGF